MVETVSETISNSAYDVQVMLNVVVYPFKGAGNGGSCRESPNRTAVRQKLFLAALKPANVETFESRVQHGGT